MSDLPRGTASTRKHASIVVDGVPCQHFPACTGRGQPQPHQFTGRGCPPPPRHAGGATHREEAIEAPDSVRNATAAMPSESATPTVKTRKEAKAKAKVKIAASAPWAASVPMMIMTRPPRLMMMSSAFGWEN